MFRHGGCNYSKIDKDKKVPKNRKDFGRRNLKKRYMFTVL